MQQNSIFFAHSGGVTAVLNHIACGVIQTARTYPNMGPVLIGEHGIAGALQERLIDTTPWDTHTLKALSYIPASAFGSCRYKLKNTATQPHELKRILQVFKAHNIGYFIYNGGNDSQDTTHKLHQFAQAQGYPLTCIGIPKTIDNDLPGTDTCPGFGSAAKYIATCVREAGLDIKAMCKTSTKVFILEVMGRHAGWLAAASALAQTDATSPPHIILMPEVKFDNTTFISRVKSTVKQHGYCVVVAAEGLVDTGGVQLFATHAIDAFGHTQLGGLAPKLAHSIKTATGFKTHWAVADYLQRSAGHLASQCDHDQAYALGCASIKHAHQGDSGIMLTLKRISNTPYTWKTDTMPLADVANTERKVPSTFISACGFHITPACRTYLAPLIQGERPPPYRDGLPDYTPPPIHYVKSHCPVIAYEQA